MKAWEKFQHDLYLIANDILECLYYQRSGYKGSFYYDFNYNLSYLQSRGTFEEQIKLLDNLQDNGAINYELKVPGPYITQDYMSKNVAEPWKGKKLIQIKVNPRQFNKIYEQVSQYRPKDLKAPLTQAKVILYLRKQSNKLMVRDGDTGKDYLVTQFRPGLAPDEIFSWVLNKAPNTTATRTVLGIEGGISTKRKLNEIIDKSIPPLLREIFVVSSTPDTIQIRSEAVVDRMQFELVLSELSKSI